MIANVNWVLAAYANAAAYNEYLSTLRAFNISPAAGSAVLNTVSVYLTLLYSIPPSQTIFLSMFVCVIIYFIYLSNLVTTDPPTDLHTYPTPSAVTEGSAPSSCATLKLSKTCKSSSRWVSSCTVYILYYFVLCYTPFLLFLSHHVSYPVCLTWLLFSLSLYIYIYIIIFSLHLSRPSASRSLPGTADRRLHRSSDGVPTHRAALLRETSQRAESLRRLVCLSSRLLSINPSTPSLRSLSLLALTSLI